MAGSTVTVELYSMMGMGHAIAIGADPDSTCPATSDAYFSDEKICSTTRAAAFFGLGDGGPGPGSGSGSGSGSDLPPDGSHPDSSDGGGCNTAGDPGFLALVFVGGLARRWRHAVVVRPRTCGLLARRAKRRR